MLQKTRHCAASHFLVLMVLWVAFATHLVYPLYIEPMMWHRQEIICQGHGDREGQECSRRPHLQMGGGGGTWLSMCRYGGGERKCVCTKSKREESMNSQHRRKRTERLKKCTVVTPLIYIFGKIEIYWQWEKNVRKIVEL